VEVIILDLEITQDCLHKEGVGWRLSTNLLFTLTIHLNIKIFSYLQFISIREKTCSWKIFIKNLLLVICLKAQLVYEIKRKNR